MSHMIPLNPGEQRFAFRTSDGRHVLDIFTPMPDGALFEYFWPESPWGQTHELTDIIDNTVPHALSDVRYDHRAWLTPDWVGAR